MTDNTQELDEILENLTTAASDDQFMDDGSIGEAKVDILDWHNKLVIAELEELLGQQDHEGHLVEPTSNSVRDRINKLKESKRL